MPSHLHETLVEIVRTHAELVPALARLAGQPIRGSPERAPSSETFSVPQFHADAVILMTEAGATSQVVVVEIQLGPDEEKRWSLPVYQALGRARHRAPCTVLVVAPERRVAARLRVPIDLDAGSTCRPVVIGPEELDFPGAAAGPELAFLRALANARKRPELVEEAIESFRHVRNSSVAVYFDLLVRSLPEQLRRALESKMFLKKFPYSPLVRKYIVEPIEEANARGLSEGRADGLRASLRAVLEARGLVLSRADAATVDHERDLETLKAWVARAALADATSDVFSPKKSRPKPKPSTKRARRSVRRATSTAAR